jgi:hypothetical protein
MSSSPLFNPFAPSGRATTLDHFDLIEEEVDERAAGDADPKDEAEDPSSPRQRD